MQHHGPNGVQPGQVGRFFGIDENFVGMAIVVNTNRQLLNKDKKPGEPVGRHKDVAIVANNGTRSYADLIGSLEGCTANVRFDERRDDFNVMQVRFGEKAEMWGSWKRQRGRCAGNVMRRVVNAHADLVMAF